jgi:hypothetical protein
MEIVVEHGEQSSASGGLFDSTIKSIPSHTSALMRTSNRTKANIYLSRSQLSDLANTPKSPAPRRPSNERTVDHDVQTALGIVSFEHS